MKHAPEFLKLCAEATAKIQEITLEELQKRLKHNIPCTLIDVREDHEWNKGHLPGAQHLGRGIIERDIEAHYPDKSSELILYCGGGYRSALAVESLQKMGYHNLYSLAGGIREWKEAGLPVAIPR